MTKKHHSLINCPRCGSATKVGYSIKQEEGTRRSHKCTVCACRFMTVQRHPVIVPYSQQYLGKLTAEQRLCVCEFRDQGHTLMEIVGLMEEHHNVTIGTSAIRAVLKARDMEPTIRRTHIRKAALQNHAL